jgi:cytochrome c oxidase assembly factor CtaG
MRCLALLALLVPAPALAHARESHGGWTLDPWVTGPLLLTALLYATGFARLWRRSDQGRPSLRRGAALFTGGWATLAGAIVSPLHAAGEASFTFHMAEHELIMLPAALLLVVSRPGAAMLWGLPAAMRGGLGGIARRGKGLWRFVTDPVVATALQLAAMWAWHAPGPFDRALDSQSWHIAQHISFLVAALLFWWAMMHGRGGRYRWGTSAFCLFVTSLAGGALGALMALSRSPWYAGYAAMGMTPSGLTPAEDQQLAGLLMWIPGGAFHGAAALVFLWKWLNASEVGHALAAE